MSRRGGRNNRPLFHRQAAALINSRAMQNFLSRQRFQIVPPGGFRRSRINGSRRYASASQRDRNSTSRSRGNSRRSRRRRARRSQAELPERNITINIDPMDLLSAFDAVISWCRELTSVSLQVETTEENLNFIFTPDGVAQNEEQNSNDGTDDQDTEDASEQNPRQQDQDIDESADDRETDDANDQNPRQEVRGSNENTNDQNPRRELGRSNENTNDRNSRQEGLGSDENANNQEDH
nr:penicillin-binding protein 1A/1B-like [Drosophila suzukii]